MQRNCPKLPLIGLNYNYFPLCTRYPLIDFLTNYSYQADSAFDLGYVAPEARDPMTLDEPDPGHDWWSSGVLLMELATGRYFSDLHPSGTLRSHNRPEMPSNLDERLPGLTSLLSGLLHPVPGARLDDRGVREHHYFRGCDWGNE